MELYMTSEKFAKLTLDKFESRMKDSWSNTVGDQIIYMMLTNYNNYRKEIEETLAGSLWGIEDYDNYEDVYNVVGSRFQKSFRQTDVTDSPNIDSVIWVSLSDATKFHKVLRTMCKTATSKEATEVCDEW